MKSIMRLYNNVRSAVRIAFIGFAFIAFGYLIQSENVNIFYTFTNRTLLMIAEGAYELGEIIILNLPLIFMVNLTCKRANSGFPIILAVIGYATFIVTVSLFANQNMDAYVYDTALNGLIKLSGVNKVYEMGMIGSFIVAFATRLTYIASRNKGRYSLLGFLNKDTMAIVYNIAFCVLLGLISAYLYPLAFEILGKALRYISNNLADSRRIALYGFIDRFMSILGLGQLVRYPFWYTSMGGSYSSILTGQVVVGDVNIWNYIQDAASTYVGAGRFITPYYIINMFMIPAIYVGMYLSMSDRKERAFHLIPMIVISLLSIICGNPLPVELALLFTAPLLLLIYLLIVVAAFFVTSQFGVYLGFGNVSNDLVTAMPGSFPDYIINMRNINLSDDVSKIFIIGIVFFAVMLILTMLYYRFLAFDILRTGKTEDLGDSIIEAVGGYENISSVGNGLLKVNIGLYDLELISAGKLQQVPATRVVETKEGISIELGVCAEIIAKFINRRVSNSRKTNK